jgi:hypothetical protein
MGFHSYEYSRQVNEWNPMNYFRLLVRDERAADDGRPSVSCRERCRNDRELFSAMAFQASPCLLSPSPRELGDKNSCLYSGEKAILCLFSGRVGGTAVSGLPKVSMGVECSYSSRRWLLRILPTVRTRSRRSYGSASGSIYIPGTLV